MEIVLPPRTRHACFRRGIPRTTRTPSTCRPARGRKSARRRSSTWGRTWETTAAVLASDPRSW
ncbi:hypothetical protein QJS66_21410 [Kocuria rhizophila]|nr:hypothetical protein QJS66_21410 [Kocuria rhizophila]